MTGRRTERSLLWAVLPSALGAALLLLNTSRYGVALSDDSAYYLSAAQNLLAGRGYTTFAERALVIFPLLYPTALAIPMLAGSGPLFAARLVSIACFAVTIFIAARWLSAHLSSAPLSLLGALSVALSIPLLNVSVYAWSEPLFIALALLSLLEMARFGQKAELRPILLSASYAALACLTRYVGFTLIVTGLLALSMNPRPFSRPNVMRAAMFLVVSATPMMLWLFRNSQITSDLLGGRDVSQKTLIQTLEPLPQVISSWVMPETLSNLGSIVLVAAVTIFALVFRSKAKLTSIHWTALRPLVTFVIVYLASGTFVMTRTFVDSWGDRLLAPIYIPLVLAFLLVVDGLLAGIAGAGRRQLAHTSMALAMALWLIYPTRYAVSKVRASLDEGAGGFHATRWVDSDLVRYLRTNQLSGPTYSNAAARLYLLTRLSGTGFTSPGTPHSLGELEQFEARRGSRDAGQAHLVIFNDVLGGWPSYLERLSDRYEMETILRTADGAIYSVGAARASSSMSGGWGQSQR